LFFFENLVPKSNLQSLKLVKLRHFLNKTPSQLQKTNITGQELFPFLDLAMLFPIQKRDSIQSKNPSQFEKVKY